MLSHGCGHIGAILSLKYSNKQIEQNLVLHQLHCVHFLSSQQISHVLFIILHYN